MTNRRALQLLVAVLVCVLWGAQSVWANPSPSSSSTTSTTSKSTTATSTTSASRAAQYYEQGRKYVDAKDFARAAAQFESAVAAQKDYAEAFNLLGFSYRHLGDFKRALVAYKTALTLKPEFAEAHEYMGEAYLEIGDLASAMKHYLILQKLKSSEAAELWDKIVSYVESSAVG